LEVVRRDIFLPDLVQLLLQVVALLPVDLELVLQQLALLVDLLHLAVFLCHSGCEVVDFVSLLVVLDLVLPQRVLQFLAFRFKGVHTLTSVSHQLLLLRVRGFHDLFKLSFRLLLVSFIRVDNDL